jgi:hypothetical protein
LGFHFLVGARDFSRLYNVQTSSIVRNSKQVKIYASVQFWMLDNDAEQNFLIKRASVTGGWRKLYNKGLHYLLTHLPRLCPMLKEMWWLLAAPFRKIPTEPV